MANPHQNQPTQVLNLTVKQQLFGLLKDFHQQESSYDCTVLTDREWLETGIIRSLTDSRSGCGFLQELTLTERNPIDKTHYFETLKSKRRLQYITDLTNAFTYHHAQLALKTTPDANIHPSLKDYHLYAGDGHFHTASSHDEKTHNSDQTLTKYPIGHLYSLNLRNHHLTHLALGSDGSNKKPHDIKILKRLETKILRQNAPTGQKILYVWDRASIDFQQWDRWKWTNAIYFLSREKGNMKLTAPLPNHFDNNDPINAGVISDHTVSHSQGSMIRRITIILPDNGGKMSFLTNLPNTVPPGVIAHLYFKRWQIEKTFDEIKNKMHEKKAWAKSNTAKIMQGKFIALAHNLVSELHTILEEENHLVQAKEIKRRAERMRQLKIKAKELGVKISSLRESCTKPLQKSIKYYRWLAHQIMHAHPWHHSITQLRTLYDHF